MPPLLGVAVKVTDVPLQIVVWLAATDTPGVTPPPELPMVAVGALKTHPLASDTDTVWLPAARLLYTVVVVKAPPSIE